MTPRAPRARRGNYALLLALSMSVILGFGALAIDYAYMLTTHAQCQDVADAASQAGMVVLRQTGSTDDARAAAAEVVASNEVAGEPAELLDIVFGSWQEDGPAAGFRPGVPTPNAVQAVVGRIDEDRVPFFLASLWGLEDFEVRADAISATRSSQILFILDITGSWGENDFADARDAVVGALDTLAVSASGLDEVGMTIFTNRYAWEYTPLTQVTAPGASAGIRSDWLLLNIASKAGVDTNPYDGADCSLYSGSRKNDFTDPAGGCYPAMPREYRDEPGTDHSTGLGMARQMFTERLSEARYRAAIVVTDGRPNGLPAASGTARAAVGYVEDRWREFVGPVPRTGLQIRNSSINAAERMWQDLGVHTWVVSLRADDWMMPAMAQGDGTYTLTNDPTELSSILQQIVSELPLAIVD